MDTKKLERSFVFGNQRESNFDIALAGIEQGSFGEFPVGFGANRRRSFNRGAGSGNGFGCRDQLGAAALDFPDAALDFR